MMIKNLEKGARVQARFFQAHLAGLAGAQMKVGATERVITGVITHVYGDHPTAPLRFEVVIQPNDGTPEVTIDPKHIVALNPGTPEEQLVRVHEVGPIPEE